MITSDATPEGQSGEVGGDDCGDKVLLVVKEHVVRCTAYPKDVDNRLLDPDVESHRLAIKHFVDAEERLRRLSERKHARTVVLGVFFLSIMFTFTMIVLQGLKLVHLDNDLMYVLTASTVGQAAALVWWIVRYIFR